MSFDNKKPQTLLIISIIITDFNKRLDVLGFKILV